MSLPASVINLQPQEALRATRFPNLKQFPRQTYIGVGTEGSRGGPPIFGEGDGNMVLPPPIFGTILGK